MSSAAGGLLIFTGIGHLFLSTLGTRRFWASIVSSGWLNTVVLEPRDERERDHSLAFWATAGSFAVPVVLIGALVVWMAADGREPPLWLGLGVCAYGVLTSSVAVKGGFWLVCAAGVLLLVAA